MFIWNLVRAKKANRKAIIHSKRAKEWLKKAEACIEDDSRSEEWRMYMYAALAEIDEGSKYSDKCDKIIRGS